MTLEDNYPLAIPAKIYNQAITFEFPKQEKNRRGIYRYAVIDGFINGEYWWRFEYERGQYNFFVVKNGSGFKVLFTKTDSMQLTEGNVNQTIVEVLKSYLEGGLSHHEKQFFCEDKVSV
jgi:hypothetical protein